MSCQICGSNGPTKQVVFYQNIGALVMRFSKTIDGRLCKNCIHHRFWSMTGTTLVLGWWGVISLIVTPFFLLNNIVRYGGCLSMPDAPEGAGRVQRAPEIQGAPAIPVEPMKRGLPPRKLK